VPGFNNLYINAGHFRNGLVLAPASVRLMRNILLAETPIVDPLPYAVTTSRPSAEMF
jgi:glycine oxidase